MNPARRYVLGMGVDGTSYEAAAHSVLHWAHRGEPRYVCLANVHMVMEAHDDPSFRALVNNADLITPDGMPLVWALRRLGVASQARVYGPTLMLHVCALAEREGIGVGLYGGTPESVTVMQDYLRQRYPALSVPYVFAPPFRALTEAEDAEVVRDILVSGARVLFVGLGCPKQERWMAAHKDRLPLVTLGVGAAFDFHSGRVKQAPRWLQLLGLEWLFRLAMEPRRLWRRYLKHNPRFLGLLGLQLMGLRRS